MRFGRCLRRHHTWSQFIIPDNLNRIQCLDAGIRLLNLLEQIIHVGGGGGDYHIARVAVLATGLISSFHHDLIKSKVRVSICVSKVSIADYARMNTLVVIAAGALT